MSKRPEISPEEKKAAVEANVYGELGITEAVQKDKILQNIVYFLWTGHNLTDIIFLGILQTVLPFQFHLKILYKNYIQVLRC